MGIIDNAGSDMGRLAVLDCPEASLAHEAELIEALHGDAVKAVLRARTEQIVLHGHGREHDADLAIGQLPRRAKDFLSSAIDVIDATTERRDLEVGKKRLARCAAMCLAAIDRLNMVPEAKRG